MTEVCQCVGGVTAVVRIGCKGQGCFSFFLYLCHSVFDWLHSHRFLYLPVKPVLFFRGGEWWKTPPLSLSFPPSTTPLLFLQMAFAAHTSALCANHAHRLQILFLSEHKHTHSLLKLIQTCYRLICWLIGLILCLLEFRYQLCPALAYIIQEGCQFLLVFYILISIISCFVLFFWCCVVKPKIIFQCG